MEVPMKKKTKRVTGTKSDPTQTYYRRVPDKTLKKIKKVIKESK